MRSKHSAMNVRFQYDRQPNKHSIDIHNIIFEHSSIFGKISSVFDGWPTDVLCISKGPVLSLLLPPEFSCGTHIVWGIDNKISSPDLTHNNVLLHLKKCVFRVIGIRAEVIGVLCCSLEMKPLESFYTAVVLTFTINVYVPFRYENAVPHKRLKTHRFSHYSPVSFCIPLLWQIL